jgi:alanyl-tRNA synthetase
VSALFGEKYGAIVRVLEVGNFARSSAAPTSGVRRDGFV